MEGSGIDVTGRFGMGAATAVGDDGGTGEMKLVGLEGGVDVSPAVSASVSV